MVDDTLQMRPCRQRHSERLARILVDRLLQQVQRPRIAFGVEGEHAGHGAQREVMRAQFVARLAQRVLDLRRAQARLQRRGDARGEILLGGRIAAHQAVGAMRPELPAARTFDQTKQQPHLRAAAAHRTAELIARQMRLAHHRHAGAGQRGRQVGGDVTSRLGVIGFGLDPGKASISRSRGGTNSGVIAASVAANVGLPLQGLRRRLAIAAAILDGETAEMRKAAARRDIHHFQGRRALQQFAPRALEAEVAQHVARRPAEEGEELPLQGAARGAGDRGKLTMVQR